jgi:hypothetical protein
MMRDAGPTKSAHVFASHIFNLLMIIIIKQVR